MMKGVLLSILAAGVLSLFSVVDCRAQDADSTATGDTLHVMMLLPLQLDQLDALDTVAADKAQINPASLPALHAYESLLLLADTLSQLGIHLLIEPVDFGRDSLASITRLNSLSATGQDIVLSFLPSAFNSSLTNASLRWNKPVYVFQSANPQFLCRSSLMRLMVPSNSTQIQLFATWLLSRFADGNFITITREQRREKDLASLFARVVDSISTDSGRVVRFVHTAKTWDGLKAKLKKQGSNILFVPTSDESFLTTLVNALSAYRNDYSITLCGLPTWEGFETIDVSALDSLNTHLFSGTHIDTEQVSSLAFRKAFIQVNHTDPLLQAYLAWDATLVALREQLTDLPVGFPAFAGPYNLLESAGDDCGYENKSIRVLRYSDFSLSPVN
ncbi:MAG: hypothetical protein ACK5CT_02585 [Bacteroidota bacterium]|jgi:hypothetical protein